ncbi:MAG: alpha/beta hydrolase [Chlamydiales bacterium]|nr:alpha/beta hydrolase [Chlamydiales bacterium]
MKTPLVLLSGLLSNEVLWQHQISHLSDIASIQIISPSQDTPEKMIQAILEKAPLQFALAGHSMGGWLCLEVMRAAPLRVNKLCLLNTTVRMDVKEKMLKRKEMILRVKQGGFQEIVKEIVEKFVFNSLVKNDVEKMFLEVGRDAFMNQQLSMISRRESQSVLATITCPTLVIHAMQDKNFSLEEHEELVNLIQHAKLAVVEDSGHMSPLEMPQAITALLRFWLTYF